MKNVLLVSNSGGIIGGGEISFCQLIENLDRSRFRPFVVSPQEGEFTAEINRLGVASDIVAMPSLRGVGLIKLPGTVGRFREVIRKTDSRVVHTNGSRCMVYAGLAARFSGIPVIWHVRVMTAEPLFDAFLARLATKIIVNSQAVARRFPAHVFKKIDVVYNGVDTKRFDPSIRSSWLRQRYSIDGDAPIVTLIGRMDHWKGHTTFLRAAPRILCKKPNATFLLVGDGPLRGPLEELSRRLNVHQRVIFAGLQPANRIPEILADSDLLVSSSVAEGFGRVIVEAMAMAKAVVATSVGGVPEIVLHDQTGILVESENAREMGEAIVSLLDAPSKREEMGMAGLQRVKDHFRIEDHVRGIEKIYDSFERT